MGKLLLLISIGVTALAAALSFVNHSKLSAATQGMVEAQAKSQQLQTELSKSGSELKKTKDSLASKMSDSDQVSQQLQASQAELAKVKPQVDDLTKQNQDDQTKITALNGQVADLTSKVNAATPTPTPSTAEADLQAQAAEQKARADKLQTDLDSTRNELGQIKQKEKARVQGEMVRGVEGRILAVNSAWNFVVLSLGDRNGVANNTELLIKRGTQFVGKVRVTSVSPSTSIADIVANSVPQGTIIQPGDNVIYQNQSTDEQPQ